MLTLLMNWGEGAPMISVMLSEIAIFEQCPKMLGAIVMIYSSGAYDRKANFKHFSTWLYLRWQYCEGF